MTKIGFCFDIAENHPLYQKRDENTAEYESEQTINWMAGVLEEMGEVIRLPWNKDIFLDFKKHKPDVVFNITESWGSRNRESFVPNICEILNIPYTGSDGLALAASLDKAMTKQIVQSLGIATPGFFKIKSVENLPALLAEYDLDFPLFVKPNNEGSSIGIEKTACTENKEELEQEIQKTITRYQESVLVEEFMPGREFTVSLLGNDKPRVFPVAEILTGGGEFDFYSYEYKEQHDKIIKCPVDISSKAKNMMINASLAIFEALECRDLARVDFKMDPQGDPAFIEINPLPGLSPYYSIYPKQAEKENMSSKQIIKKLISFAQQRGAESF